MTVLSPDSMNFRSYGKIIEYPNKKKKGSVRNLWRIVHTENSRVGWRIAYLVLRDKTIGRMESHRYSDETFEPIKGKVLMFVSGKPTLDQIKCFKLDKPVIVRKGIWHGLVAVDSEAEIKITENVNIKCRYWKLGFRARSIKDFIARKKDEII